MEIIKSTLGSGWRWEAILTYHGEFQATFQNADAKVRKILELLLTQYRQWSQHDLFRLEYALRELFNNAIEHGNKLQSSKKVTYFIKCIEERLEIDVSDEGDGFDLSQIEKLNDPSDFLRERNRGLLSMIAMGFKLRVSKGNVNAQLVLNNIDINKNGGKPVEIYVQDSIAFYYVNTNLIAANIKKLIEEFQTEIKNLGDYQNLQIDLSKADSVDSMGITFLIGIYKTMASQGKKITLTGVSPALVQLFKIMKLDELFEITNR